MVLHQSRRLTSVFLSENDKCEVISEAHIGLAGLQAVVHALIQCRLVNDHDQTNRVCDVLEFILDDSHRRVFAISTSLLEQAGFGSEEAAVIS